MFFEGGIQSGIATATQESKAVACFIRDDSETSLKWENELLREEAIAQGLRQKTVLLRIPADSQDAQYLSAFCPVKGAPGLVIIKDGMIKAKLSSDHNDHEWRRLLLEALGSEVPLGASSSQAEQSDVQAQESEQRRAPDNLDSTSGTTPPTPSGKSSDGSVLRATEGSSSIGTVSRVEISSSDRQLPFNSALRTTPPASSDQPSDNSVQSATDGNSNHDITSRVETPPPDGQLPQAPEREAQEITEEPEQAARIRARREQAQADARDSSTDSRRAGEKDYAEKLRKRKEEARRERERIMKLVESDRLERKARDERRKMLAQAKTEKNTEHSEPKLATGSDTKEPSKECALQVRLLDGKTLRSRFPSDQTLSKDVRSWIDSHRTDGDSPYNFKQILVPQPNRTLSISDEQETLASLGLTPSATLVLFPVSGYTNAYDGAAAPGLLSKGLSAGYGVVSSGVGMITGALGSLLGVGQRAASGAQNANEPGSGVGSSSAAQPSRTIRVKTLHDQAREREDQQYYNGNQLNFEPNKDEGKADQ